MARTSVKIPTKFCVKCKKPKPMSDFYSNADWASQGFTDAWCKECVGKKCVDMQTTKEYCWYNNRLWADTVWEKAVKQAQYIVSTDPAYVKGAQSTKETILSKYVARQFIKTMNLTGNYKYSNNISDEEFKEFDDESSAGVATDGEIIESIYDGKRIYDPVWRGDFTEKEIDALNKAYRDLEEDFSLDNANLRDYARAICKASLEKDNAYDRYRRGKIQYKDYQAALDSFDKLSKSAEFAQCKRKPGDSTGMGSLGEIIARIEGSGILKTIQVEFPPDDIDKVIADFTHTLTAIGIDGVSGL